MREKRCLLFFFFFIIIPLVYIFRSKIKRLLQYKINGLDCSSLFVLICHLLEDVVYLDSIIEGKNIKRIT